MKWVVINAIALLAAIAIFGGSVVYAATNIKEVEQVLPVESETSDYVVDEGWTAADILFPPASSIEDAQSSEISSEIPSEVSSEPPVSSSPISSEVVSSEPPPPPPSSELVSSEPLPPSSDTEEIIPPTVDADSELVDMIAGAVQREIVGVNTPPQEQYYEAYKAQAVASHTYMKYHQKSDGSYPTMSYTKPHPKTVELVAEVVNELIYYNGSIINASYHASSGGGTQSASYVWGNDIPYLVGIESPYDDYAGTCTISADELGSRLNSVGIQTTSDPYSWFDLGGASYSDGGFIDYIPVCGQNLKGRTLRESVIGGSKLKSCKISDISFDGTSFTFITNGFGHGVGLSQIGALGYAANEGMDYRQILEHYYQGAVVQ